MKRTNSSLPTTAVKSKIQRQVASGKAGKRESRQAEKQASRQASGQVGASRQGDKRASRKVGKASAIPRTRHPKGAKGLVL